ncbi:hypothetical protein GCM10023347_32850 [Streptomyces chumphonensis]|uniref:Uncharacterized protein n=1 Tax=Streptomyces chumphonensis TaxID=1214925 RepID=A0A927IEB4_9ACTN|nr:hypothetical protein [Streptomyces chumphonensis]MBD3933539.1 hypothetical protein [Streptomyces chumphonensis]
MTIPQQATSSQPDANDRPDPPDHRPPHGPHDTRRFVRTEATRLLCGGVHLDHAFRTAVITELVDQEHRPVAPSLGVDVVSVLSHALRARAVELRAASAVIALWLCFLVLNLALGGTTSDPALSVFGGGWTLLFGLAGLLLFLARQTSGLPASRLRICGVLLVALCLVLLLVVPLAGGAPALFLVGLLPLAVAVPRWALRWWQAGIVRTELDRDAFRTAPEPHLPAYGRYPAIEAAVTAEQHSPLTVYDPSGPFVGAGVPYNPWTVALELKRADATEPGEEGPSATGSGEDEPADAVPARLTAREVIDVIGPRLLDLRRTASDDSRDRLRGLELDEFVYLPGGLARQAVRRDAAALDEHRRVAVNEGGEWRRHFLRVRVGAWQEQLVVSLFVRVHTQGGMLVLEVAPHVLPPVRRSYAKIGELAETEGTDPLRSYLRALLNAPVALFESLRTVGTVVLAACRRWMSRPHQGPAEGPRLSVRERGATATVSLFQEMDVNRYIQTVQDRIASGVRDALRSAGYQTDEFQQQIVQVSGNGMFIGKMSGGTAQTGDRAQVINEAAKAIRGAAKAARGSGT